MDEREQALRSWFSAWIDRNAAVIDEIFADSVAYSECYGPEYRGIGQVKRWFQVWNRKGSVLRWDMHETFRDGDVLIATWYFCCEYEGKTDGFDGVTIAQFDKNGKIVSLREFESKAEHVFPYGDKKET